MWAAAHLSEYWILEAFFILNIMMVGYSVALVGFVLGIMFALVTNKYGSKMNAILLSFTAGILLSFISFEMLPLSFMVWGLYLSSVGILLGVLFSVFIEHKFDNLHFNFSTKGYDPRSIKIGMLIGIGVAVHNIAEGLALGSLLVFDYNEGMTLALLIAIHCFPEGIAICIPLKKSGISYYNIILYCLIFSVPMAVGTIAGGFLSKIDTSFIGLCLSFAGGVMLYITCGQIIPESKSIWDSKTTTFVSCLGFVVGLFLIKFI